MYNPNGASAGASFMPEDADLLPGGTSNIEFEAMAACGTMTGYGRGVIGG